MVRQAHHERQGRSPRTGWSIPRTAGRLTTKRALPSRTGRSGPIPFALSLSKGGLPCWSRGRSWFDRLTTNGRGARQRRAPSIPRTAGAPTNEGRRAYHERQGRPPTKGAEYTTNGRGAHQRRAPSIPRTAGAPTTNGVQRTYSVRPEPVEGRGASRVEYLLKRCQSPSMSACFFRRDHLLICLSLARASSRTGNSEEYTSLTGSLLEV